MAVAEVYTLSGYKFDEEETHKLTGTNDLQRADLSNDNTLLNIYFNQVINWFGISLVDRITLDTIYFYL